MPIRYTETDIMRYSMLYKFPVLISSYDDDDVDDVDGHDDVDVDGDDGADDGVGGADGDDGDDDGGDDGDCSAVHWEVGRATRKTLPPSPSRAPAESSDAGHIIVVVVVVDVFQTLSTL